MQFQVGCTIPSREEFILLERNIYEWIALGSEEHHQHQEAKWHGTHWLWVKHDGIMNGAVLMNCEVELHFRRMNVNAAIEIWNENRKYNA